MTTHEKINLALSLANITFAGWTLLYVRKNLRAIRTHKRLMGDTADIPGAIGAVTGNMLASALRQHINPTPIPSGGKSITR